MSTDGKVRIGVDLDESGFRAGLSKLSSTARSAISGAGSAAFKVGVAAKDALAGIGKTAAVSLGAATAATAAFAKTSIDAGKSFDASMSQVAATMGKTTDEIKDLRAAAIQAGSTTAFSATEAADALNYLALAGYDATTAADTLPAVLNLAAAGGMDLAYASDLATDAMSALGIEAGNANLTAFGDKMAVTASKANTSVAQLGEAILQVGATAQMLSGGTTELNAALGILADNGTKGAEGGTRLRNIILSLTAPTDTAAARLAALGVSVFDASGDMRSLSDILADLNASMSSFSSDERIRAVNEIFNKTDIGDVNYLLGVSKERWNELSVAIDGSQGAMQKMANTQLDNLAGDITMFKSALEGAQIVLFESMNPTLREFAQFGTRAVNELSEGFQRGGLKGLSDALDSVAAEAISMLSGVLPALLEAGIGLLEAVVNGIIQNLPVLLDAAVKIVVTLSNGIMKALPQLIGKIPEILRAFYDAIVAAGPEMLKAGKELLRSLAEGARNGAALLSSAAPEAIRQFLGVLNEKLPEFLNYGSSLISTLVQGVQENLPVIIEAGAQMLSTLLNGLAEALPEIASVAVQIVQTLVSGIISALPSMLEAAGAVISAIGSALRENLPALQATGIQILQTIAEGLSSGIETVTGALPEIVGAILAYFTENLPELLEAGVSLVKTIAEGILNGVGNIAEALPEILREIMAFFRTNGKDILAAGAEILGYIVQGILDAMPVLYDTLAELVLTFLGVGDAVNEGFGEKTKVLSGIFQGLTVAIVAAKAAILGYKVAMEIASVIEAVGNAISWLTNLTNLQAAAQAALNFVMNMNPFVKVATLIMGVVGALSALIFTSDEFREVASYAFEVILGLVNALLDALSKLPEALSGAIGNIFGGGESKSTASGGASRTRMARAMAVNETADNGEAVSPTASPLAGYDRAAAVRALETAMPAVQARVMTATAAMAPAAGYSMPPSLGNAYGGGNSQQAAQIIRPVVTVNFTGDLAQLGRVLNPIIKSEDIRLGPGV